MKGTVSVSQLSKGIELFSLSSDACGGCEACQDCKPRADLPDNVTLEIGLFQDKIDGFLERGPGPVKFMHVDSDLYSSANFILEALVDRIDPGTVSLFNGFLKNPGWENGEAKARQESTARYTVDFAYIGWASKKAVSPSSLTGFPVGCNRPASVERCSS